MDTQLPSSGEAGGPLGCGGALIVLTITILAIGALGAAIIWMLHDTGQL